jgi:hypothetical protein
VNPAVGLLLWAQATLVSVDPGPEGACPSARQVAEALALRMPGVVVAPDRAGAVGALRLRLTATAGGEAAFALSEPQGRVRLYRTLRPSEGAGPGECLALAETVALIVERYLQELDARARSGDAAEPVPAAATAKADAPRAPGWRISLAGLYRPAEAAPSSFGGGLRVGRAFAGRPLLLAGAFGWHPRRSAELGGGAAGLGRFPADVALLLRLPGGTPRGEAQAGPVVGLDTVLLDSRVGSDNEAQILLAPWIGVGLGYGLWVGRRAFVRFGGAAGVLFTRYQVEQKGVEAVVFNTGRYLVRLDAEVGFAF